LRTLFAVAKWLDFGYLAYLGLIAIFGRPSPVTASSLSSADKPAWKIWFSGLALQLANPKALIFFVAILPRFVNPIGNLPLQMIWLAAGSMIPELLILVGYGALAGRMQAVATRARICPSNPSHRRRLDGGCRLARCERPGLMTAAGACLKIAVAIRSAELLGARHKVYDCSRGMCPSGRPPAMPALSWQRALPDQALSFPS
jgi:hypothetical protein